MKNPMGVNKSLGVYKKTLNDVKALLYIIAVCIGFEGVLRKFQQDCVKPRTCIIECAGVLVDVSWGHVFGEINYYLIPLYVTPEVHYCFLTFT